MTIQSIIDINAQAEGGFVTAKDDTHEALRQADVFAFAESITGSSSWSIPKGSRRHTALVLGEGYPTIVVSSLHRRTPKSTLRTTPPEDESGYTTSEVAEFDYHIEHTGYLGDFDTAQLEGFSLRLAG